MGHKTLINGTAYEIIKGKSMISGTTYEITKGKSMISGTTYEINLDTGPSATLYTDNSIVFQEKRKIDPNKTVSATYKKFVDNSQCYGNWPWSMIKHIIKEVSMDSNFSSSTMIKYFENAS